MISADLSVAQIVCKPADIYYAHYGRNAGAFWLSHSLSAACDSNSATSMLSMVGAVSPNTLDLVLVISRIQSTRRALQSGVRQVDRAVSERLVEIASPDQYQVDNIA